VDLPELREYFGETGRGALPDVVRGNDRDACGQIPFGVAESGGRNDHCIFLSKASGNEKAGEQPGYGATHETSRRRLPRRLVG
jgi:hypothetical protein